MKKYLSVVCALGLLGGPLFGQATETGVFASTERSRGTITATASSGAATLNKPLGVITSEAITTASGASYTLTLTNSTVSATSVVLASTNLGAGTGGTPCVTSVTPDDGSVVILVKNVHASAAFNAAIKVAFRVLN